MFDSLTICTMTVLVPDGARGPSLGAALATPANAHAANEKNCVFMVIVCEERRGKSHRIRGKATKALYSNIRACHGSRPSQLTADVALHNASRSGSCRQPEQLARPVITDRMVGSEIGFNSTTVAGGRPALHATARGS